MITEKLENYTKVVEKGNLIIFVFMVYFEVIFNNYNYLLLFTLVKGLTLMV